MIGRAAILFILAGSLVSGSLAIVKYAVLRDYPVIASVACNPDFESCFVGDGENTPELFKIVEKTAGTIPPCDAWHDGCKPLSCVKGETGCRELLCTGDECYSGSSASRPADGS